MTAIAPHHGQSWRIAGWGCLAALLALPAVAMRYTAEVHWTALDFAAAAALLALLGLGVEFAASRPRGGLGMALAVLTAFLLVWVNLAVGLIGSERNPDDLIFAGVLVVAVGGACLARFRPAGMARAMVATAGAQTLVGAVAVAAGLGAGGPAWPWDVVASTVTFDGLWLLAALLFHRAAAH